MADRHRVCQVSRRSADTETEREEQAEKGRKGSQLDRRSSASRLTSLTRAMERRDDIYELDEL